MRKLFIYLMFIVGTSVLFFGAKTYQKGLAYEATGATVDHTASALVGAIVGVGFAITAVCLGIFLYDFRYNDDPESFVDASGKKKLPSNLAKLGTWLSENWPTGLTIPELNFKPTDATSLAALIKEVILFLAEKASDGVEENFAERNLELEKRIAELQEELTDAQASLAEAALYKEKSQGQIGLLEKQNAQFEARLVQAGERERGNNQRIKDLSHEVDRLEQSLARLMDEKSKLSQRLLNTANSHSRVMSELNAGLKELHREVEILQNELALGRSERDSALSALAEAQTSLTHAEAEEETATAQAKAVSAQLANTETEMAKALARIDRLLNHIEFLKASRRTALEKLKGTQSGADSAVRVIEIQTAKIDELTKEIEQLKSALRLTLEQKQAASTAAHTAEERVRELERQLESIQELLEELATVKGLTSALMDCLVEKVDEENPSQEEIFARIAEIPDPLVAASLLIACGESMEGTSIAGLEPKNEEQQEILGLTKAIKAMLAAQHLRACVSIKGEISEEERSQILDEALTLVFSFDKEGNLHPSSAEMLMMLDVTSVFILLTSLATVEEPSELQRKVASKLVFLATAKNFDLSHQALGSELVPGLLVASVYAANQLEHRGKRRRNGELCFSVNSFCTAVQLMYGAIRSNLIADHTRPAPRRQEMCGPPTSPPECLTEMALAVEFALRPTT